MQNYGITQITKLKKYTLDILFITLFTVAAFIIAGKPELSYEVNMSPTSLPQGEEAKGMVKSIDKTISYKNIEERNIFSMGGSYAMSKELIPMPENPYTLIAILLGTEKRAVFKEYTGSVVSLKVGQKLIDGATITHIDRLYVKVKKGRETKEYRIFDVKSQNR